MVLRIFAYGLIGALIVGSLMYFGSLSWAGGDQPPPENGLVVGYLTQLIALITVFLGIKAHRDFALGGVIKFLPAFGIGVAISAIATLGWVISWEIVLGISDLDYMAMMKEHIVADGQKKGLTAAEIQKSLNDMKWVEEAYKIPPARMLMTATEMLPVGILVSVISAALLRNSRFLPARGAVA